MVNEDKCPRCGAEKWDTFYWGVRYMCGSDYYNDGKAWGKGTSACRKHALETRLAEAESESLEQARIIGISGERELRLMTQLEAQVHAYNRELRLAVKYKGLLDEANALLDKVKVWQERRSSAVRIPMPPTYGELREILAERKDDGK